MKLRRHASAIVLFVLALGLSAYAYWDRDRVNDVERVAREGDLFPAWRRDDVKVVELDFGTEKLRLEKTSDDAGPGAWTMTSPRHEVADYAAAESLLISLEHGRPVRKSTAPAESLEKPRIRGKIEMGIVHYTFIVGGPAPSPEGASYFELEGGEPVVIGKELTQALLANSDHYRSHAVVPYLSLQLDSLAIQNGAANWSLVRANAIAFKIEPLGVRASRSKLDKIWGALSDMRSEGFLTEGEAQKLTASGAATITMKPTIAGKSPGIMHVGGECPGHPDDVAFYREAPEPLGACVPKGALATLMAPPESFVDDGAFTVRFDEVEEVEVKNEKFTIELARSGSGFRERAPEDRMLSGDEARSASHLLEIIDKCPGASFHPGAVANGPVLGHIKVRAAESTEEIDVGDGFFKRAMDGAIIIAPQTLTTEMLPHRSLLRAARVFPPELADARVDALTLHCGLAQSFERAGEKFTATAPTGLIPDQAALSGLADTLLRLRAEAWVADEDTGPFGTHGKLCSASFTTRSDGGVTTHTIELGGIGDSGVYARVDDDPNVMVLPDSVKDLLHVIYMDLDVAESHAPLDRITVVKDSMTKILTRNDENAVAFAEMEGLAFDKVVRFGAPLPEDLLRNPWLTIDLQTKTDAGARSTVKIAFGARNGHLITARVEGIPAVYSIARSRLTAVLGSDSDLDAGGAKDAR